MKQARYLLPTLIFLPVATHAMSLQETVGNFTVFLINVIVPFLLGLGFLFFAINVIRYFVAGSANDDGREKAKNLAVYSVLGFVVILVFWGVVNMLSQSIGLTGNTPTSDYVGSEGTTGTTPGANQNPIGNIAQPAPAPTSNPPVAPGQNTGNQPINILPPQYGGPASNVQPDPAPASPGQNNVNLQ